MKKLALLCLILASFSASAVENCEDHELIGNYRVIDLTQTNAPAKDIFVTAETGPRRTFTIYENDTVKWVAQFHTRGATANACVMLLTIPVANQVATFSVIAHSNKGDYVLGSDGSEPTLIWQKQN